MMCDTSAAMRYFTSIKHFAYVSAGMKPIQAIAMLCALCHHHYSSLEFLSNQWNIMYAPDAVHVILCSTSLKCGT